MSFLLNHVLQTVASLIARKERSSELLVASLSHDLVQLHHRELVLPQGAEAVQPGVRIADFAKDVPLAHQLKLKQVADGKNADVAEHAGSVIVPLSCCRRLCICSNVSDPTIETSLMISSCKLDSLVRNVLSLSCRNCLNPLRAIIIQRQNVTMATD